MIGALPPALSATATRFALVSLWCFEKPDEVAHCVMAVLRMAKWKLVVNLITVATSLPPFRQVAGLLKVVNDRHRRSFGNADRGGDVSEPCVRVGGDPLQHVRVVRQEPPTMITVSRT